MKLPNSEKAEVPEAKIVGYLLSPTHRLGRAKAEFFRRFGFSQDHWRALREALIQHAHESDVFEER